MVLLILLRRFPIFYPSAVFNFVYTRRIKRARKIDSFTSLNENTKTRSTICLIGNCSDLKIRNTLVDDDSFLARNLITVSCLHVHLIHLSLLIILLILFFTPQKDMINKGNSHNSTRSSALPLLHKLLIEFNLQSKFRVYTEIGLGFFFFCALRLQILTLFVSILFCTCFRYDIFFFAQKLRMLSLLFQTQFFLSFL